MNIFKFQKISDKVSKYTIDKKDNKLFSSKSKWIATEKVHGSNFSIYYIDNEIKFSKRNSLLEDNEWFYNYQIIRQKLIKNIKKISSLMNKKNIIIYGELFGGWYPKNNKEWKGPENIRLNSKGVSIVPFDERAIQEGIYYTSNIEYMVFDIAYIENDEINFIDYLKMEEYIKQTDLFYSKPLIIGTFEKVQEYNINFDSKIPEQLGELPLPKGTNTAEGIVIKPLNSHYVKDKDNKNTRCLIKIKNKKFLEVADSFDINEASNSYQFILLKLVNQNRFQAVISKIGKLTDENKENILNEFIEDVLNDFYENYSHIILNDVDKANLYLKKISESLINENLKSI